MNDQEKISDQIPSEDLPSGKSRKKKILIAVIAAAAAVAVILIICNHLKQSAFYQTHFFNGTSVNGTDISGMTAEEVKGVLQKEVDQYRFTFTDHEGRSETVTAKELNAVYRDDGEITDHLDLQDPDSWLFDNGKEVSFEIPAEFDYDREALNQWISGLPCLQDGTPSKDAYIQDKEDGYQVIIEEEYGDEIDADALTGKIISAVGQGGSSFTIEGTDLFLKPSVTADDQELNAEVDANNQKMDDYYAALARREKISEITDMKLMLNTWQDKVYIDRELLKGMIEDDENGDPVISEKKFKKWFRNWAEERGLTENNNLFVTHGGRLMQVANGPYMGWSMDYQATEKKAWKSVQDRDGGVFYCVLKDSEGKKQTDSTYIEINIMKQTMWMYIDGKQLVETPVVTGNVAWGMATPSNGVWRIDRMNINYTMVGATYVAHCDYWMAFNGGIGIHDLASRTAFGGDIYKTAGSHGCVNTPHDIVEKMFANAYIGLPVVVHS